VSTSAPAVDAGAVRRILLIRQRFLGDICLALPVLEAVRAACPGARVAFAVEEQAAPLLLSDRRVDELIVTPRHGVRGWTRAAGSIRRFAPDVVLDLFCNPRTAIWTRLSGARVRVGYEGKGWRSSLYTHHVRPRTLSAVEFHLASVAALGWRAPVATPRLAVSPAGIEAAQVELLEHGIPPDAMLVGFHPGARWPTRRWSPERFTQLASRFLAERPSGIAVVTGSHEERELAQGIVAALPPGRAMAAVGWPIARFVGLQSLCAAFVSGDSGPLHTAVATGTPTLGLMSRNTPAAFFPYPEREGHVAYYARVECSHCNRDVCDDLRCLKRLTAEGAWERLARMLDRGKGFR
jgi:ADP-heptose:LPS heptosyltransferase